MYEEDIKTLTNKLRKEIDKVNDLIVDLHDLLASDRVSFAVLNGSWICKENVGKLDKALTDTIAQYLIEKNI